jgi:hypothetical protein
LSLTIVTRSRGLVGSESVADLVETDFDVSSATVARLDRVGAAQELHDQCERDAGPVRRNERAETIGDVHLPIHEQGVQRPAHWGLEYGIQENLREIYEQNVETWSGAV